MIMSSLNPEFIKVFKSFTVRRLSPKDEHEVLELYLNNAEYFGYFSTEPTLETVKEDMFALPPGKTMQDKFFIGFFDRNGISDDKLCAVMDIIDKYPDDESIFIGLLMVAASEQNKGKGSKIVTELCEGLKEYGYRKVKLGFIKSNVKAKCFWLKNDFLPTGKEYLHDNYTVVEAERTI